MNYGKQFDLDVKRYELSNVDEILVDLHGDRFKNYLTEFEKASNCTLYSHPMYIVLEVNDYCNMKCKMCRYGREGYKQGKQNMDLNLLDKLVLDANKAGVCSFFLGGGTECLINPDINTIIKRIKTGNSIDDVLITNGYALNERLQDLLIDVGWEKVFVSLDAASKDTYTRIRGKDLSVVERNIYSLIKKRNNRGKMVPLVRVSFVVQPDNIGEKELFFDKWKDVVDIIDFQDLLDLSSDVIHEDAPETNKKCNEPFNRLFVDCEGYIYPCCTDFGKNMPLGNIKDISIEEAWNSESMVKLRNELMNGNHNLICRNCLNSIWT